MDSNPNRARTVILALAAIVLSSAMFFFGTGMRPIWWLTWLATLPVLLIAPRVPAFFAFGIAALSWFAGTLNMWRYLRHILVLPDNPHAGPLVMPLGVAIGVLIVPSCIFGLAVLLSRSFMRRGVLWRATLALPAVWVTYEYLTAVFSPHSTFGNLAYTQMDFLPMLQLASVAGVSGITFCVFLLPSAIAASPAGTERSQQKRILAGTIGAFYLVVMLFGWARLHFTPKAEHSVAVGLAASDLPRNLRIEEPEEKGRLLRDYLSNVKSLAAQGAQVIVIPEKLSVVVDPETEEIDTLFKEAAIADKTRYVIGVLHVTKDAKLNEARIYSPDSAMVRTYEKHHMLPAFESKLRPGTTLALISQPSGLWGIAICKDMDFPSLSREYGRDGVGLLLVPAWDFSDDGWLHNRMAVMRGVESGFTIARTAKEGLLTVSDDRGRLLAEQSSASAPFASIVANAPVRNDATLYARFGDWFAWVNIALVVGLMGSAWSRRALAPRTLSPEVSVP
jgi:apolipoprotein N-acyltransferase